MGRTGFGLSLARFAVVALALALTSAEAGATLIINLGTAGNAKAWTGSTCGSLTAPVFQLGDSVGITGSLMLGNGQCGSNSAYVITEQFYLPGDAHNIVLHFDEFEASGGGSVLLNGVALFGSGDGQDCQGWSECGNGPTGAGNNGQGNGGQGNGNQANTGKGNGGSGSDDNEGPSNLGFLPGSINVMEIAFGGIRPQGLLTGVTGNALLSASITFDSTSGAASGGSTGQAVTTPEPGSWLLLAPAAVMMFAWRRRAAQSAAARTAL